MKTKIIVGNNSAAYTEVMPKQIYTGVFTKKGRWTLAWIEEIPGVNAQGRNFEEAKENLHEALSLILEENRLISGRRNTKARREKIIIVTS
jgi:predicted RNase H-like HicB family nuclease